MTANSTLQVNLAAVAANLDAFRAALPADCSVCAVVKSNAYGLGAVQVAKKLSAEGADLLAVYSLEEARQLAGAGIATPLLILQPVDDIGRTDAIYRTAVSGKLHLAVHSAEQLEGVEQIGLSFGTPVPIHLELDTGMSRGGMDEAEASDVLQRLPAMRYVKLAGIYTHPTSADGDSAATERQYQRFMKFTGSHITLIGEDVKLHFANTYAAQRSEQYHLGMVRIGLGLYGYHNGGESIGPMQPSVGWLSRIVHVRDVPSSTPVGYHGSFTTWRDSRLGIVPVGYADGYPVSLSNRGVVRVGQSLATADVRGEVNMDQIIVDLTEAPEDVGVGSLVEVYSDDPEAPNALPAMAVAARTNVYELLCRIAGHVPRQYLTTGSPRGVFPRLAQA